MIIINANTSQDLAPDIYETPDLADDVSTLQVSWHKRPMVGWGGT